jgi:hypothetical protein
MRRLDDIKKWRIEMLGRYGGFSRKFIMRQVFGVEPGDMEELAYLSCISRHLRECGVRLWDWRNGVSPVAQHYAKDVSTPKRKTRRRRA